MAKSPSERITEVEKAVAVSTNRLDTLETQVEAVGNAQKETARRQESHQRESEKEIALLREQVAQLREEQRKWSARLWNLIAAAVAIIGGAMVTALVTVMLALAGFKKG